MCPFEQKGLVVSVPRRRSRFLQPQYLALAGAVLLGVGFTGGEVWCGECSKDLAPCVALEALKDTARTDRERIIAASRLFNFTEFEVYTIRVITNDPNAPPRLRRYLGDLLSNYQALPSKTLPDWWVKRGSIGNRR